MAGYDARYGKQQGRKIERPFANGWWEKIDLIHSVGLSTNSSQTSLQKPASGDMLLRIRYM